MQKITSAPELETLLAALRLEGFTIGFSEILRLRQVFALQPCLSDDAPPHRLKSLLRAIILKDRAQTPAFDRIVEDWWQALAPVWATPSLVEPGPTPLRAPPSVPRTRRRVGKTPGILRNVWVCLRLLPVLGLVVWLAADRDTSLQTSPVKSTVSTPTPRPTPVTPAITPQAVIDVVPSIRFTPPQARWRGYREASLAALALLGVIGLRMALRRRPCLPAAEPLPRHAGPPRVWLKHPIKGPVLLDQEEQLELVWGVDRYIAETSTRQLDIPATVRASAKAGGLPIACFLRARHTRTLWLWLDESAEDATLRRLVAELSVLLPAHGLPLEMACFWGAPFTLIGTQGERFAPREIEEQRDTAWVAILTDGKDIARQDRQDDQRAKLNTLLRSLSYWPKLWFVDASAGSTGLPTLLKPYALACLPPEHLARRMVTDKPRAWVRGNPDERLWEGACALSPGPVETGLAWRLRTALKLTVSPWVVRNWQARAAGPGGRLQWPDPLRARLINGLWRAESQQPPEVGRNKTAQAGISGKLTVQMPETVASRPYSGLRQSLNSTALGVGERGSATLFNRALDFWLSVYRAEAERRQLQDGAAWQDSPAQQHWRMETALLQLWNEPALAIPELYRLFQGSLEQVIRQHLAHYAASPLAVAHDAGQPTGRMRDRDSHILLSWAWLERSGREQKMLQTMGFAGGWGVSAVNLHPPARQWLGLALALGLGLGAGVAAWVKPPVLPTGEPHIVHGPGRPAQFQQSLEPLGDGRWRLTVATDQGRAEQTLPAAALAQVEWTPKPDVTVKPAPSPACDGNAIKTRPECMAFQPIPKGDFTMGSPTTEPGHQDSELAHPVSLSAFAMGRYEVTNAQFHAYDPSHPGNEELPVSDVNWQQAHDFCQRYGYRLPTEAEWEYADRAGSTKRFPFGDDESQLKNYAWYSDNSGNNPHPVGTLKPNAWGLYDMQGNVWEWVEDWYGPYEPTPHPDPTGPKEGTSRVLRGGSFLNAPEYLRSAFRGSYGPGDRNRNIGFRCVRGPRRQP